jgi:hypothetical protein
LPFTFIKLLVGWRSQAWEFPDAGELDLLREWGCWSWCIEGKKWLALWFASWCPDIGSFLGRGPDVDKAIPVDFRQGHYAFHDDSKQNQYRRIF